MAWSTTNIWGNNGSWGSHDSFNYSNSEQVGPDNFDTFGCKVFNDDPATPDNVTPDVTISRQGYTSTNVTMPDGQSVEFWVFTDGSSSWNSTAAFPSPVMRVKQGQIVHTQFSANHGTHTIHHHAIEPTTFNDGVGHTSFEVDRSYTYQWRPARAGTYLYHCHKNTVLHFEMGMYGFLIVDPASGAKRLYDPDPADVNGVDTTYDVEALWAADDVDPTWRSLDHDAGLCGQDVGLNNFRPKYFLISGVPNNKTTSASGVVVNMKVGQRLLIRHVNASYSVLRTTITGLAAQVVGVDGRALRTNPGLGDFATPYTIPAGTPFLATTAQRHDLLVKPTVAGQYRVRMEFLHWITGQLQTAAGGTGLADTYINVS